MVADRRQHPRLSLNLPIKISDPEFDIVTETKNISAAGAYCSVNKKIPEMTKLKVILLVPVKKNKRKLLKKISCEGVVVRNEYVKTNGTHTYHIGILFNEIKQADRKTLALYVNSVLTKTTA